MGVVVVGREPNLCVYYCITLYIILLLLYIQPYTVGASSSVYAGTTCAARDPPAAPYGYLARRPWQHRNAPSTGAVPAPFCFSVPTTTVTIIHCSYNIIIVVTAIILPCIHTHTHIHCTLLCAIQTTYFLLLSAARRAPQHYDLLSADGQWFSKSHICCKQNIYASIIDRDSQRQPPP